MTRRLFALSPILVFVLFTQAPGHTGSPPSLPDNAISQYEASIPPSQSTTHVVGTTWCAYSVSAELLCKKNGTPVTLSYSVSRSSPHPYHIDWDYNVSLTPLSLQSGDVLEWEFRAKADSGPDRGTWVSCYATTQVQ